MCTQTWRAQGAHRHSKQTRLVTALTQLHAQDFKWKGAHVPLVPGLKPMRGARPLEQAVWAELDVLTFTTVRVCV